MDAIDKAGFLQRLLRRVAAPASQNTRAAHTHPVAGTSRQRATQSLEQRVLANLSMIGPAHADAVGLALEMAIQAALLDEFGPAFGNDPGFGNLLADVLEAIHQSAQFPVFEHYIQQQLLARQPDKKP
jgi:hypothetical protein